MIIKAKIQENMDSCKLSVILYPNNIEYFNKDTLLNYASSMDNNNYLLVYFMKNQTSFSNLGWARNGVNMVDGEAYIYNIADKKLIWKSTFKANRVSTYYVGDKGLANTMAKELILCLKKDGLL